MHVKVCGITRVEDAWLAAELGATALGFVLWPGSPRAIDPFQVRTIVRHLPPLVSVVGVFVDQPVDYVRRVARLVPLDAVQLHGVESAAYCREAGSRVIKAIGASPAAAGTLDQWPREVVLLLDASDPVRHGGTGRAIDWTVAATIARARPTMLAGGLRAENVATAVARVRPYGIDVSSGVEARPGIKDPSRLREFFAALATG
jgi:phosphoribosylanthranilate isomerase